MNKTLVFDMDGTIADLYGVTNWLPKLRAEDSSPYMEAKPLYDMDTMNVILDILKRQGWKVVVTSWLSKGSTPEYDKKVKKAKTDWLKKFQFPYDELNLVSYGTLKEICTKKYGGYQILIDDSKEVRDTWTLGSVIDAHKNILKELVDLI